MPAKNIAVADESECYAGHKVYQIREEKTNRFLSRELGGDTGSRIDLRLVGVVPLNHWL